MIVSLELENWKSHSHTCFSFAKGTNILVGRMGAGKSAVTDAVCFALYGTFPKMSRRDQTTESLVNIASGAECARVKLEFEKAGKKYSIERRIGKKISEAEARCDGRLLQKGPKPVTDFVIDALGVDYELFTRAIYSEQNRMDQLLSLTPRARKQEIDWLLGLGQFDDAREEAQSSAGKLSEQARALEQDSDVAKISEAEQKLSEQKTQEDIVRESCEKQRRLLEGQKRAHAEKSSALALLEKSRAEHNRKKSECDVLNGSVQRLAREIEGKTRISMAELAVLLEKRKAMEKGLVDSRKAAKSAQNDWSSVKSEIAVLKSALRSSEERQRRKEELEAKVASLSGGIGTPEIESRIAILKREGERISQERALLLAERETLDDAAEALSSAGAKCPVCDSDLSGGKSEELAREKEARALEKTALAETLSKLISSNREEVRSLEQSLSEMKSCIPQIERLSSEGKNDAELLPKLSELEAKREGIESALSETERSLALLESQLEDAKKLHDEASRTERLFAEYDSARQRFLGAEDALSRIVFDEGTYSLARSECEEASVGLASAKSELAGGEKQLTLLMEMRALVERELSQSKEKERKAKEYASAAQSMAIYKNALASAQSELRASLIEEINEALLEIWPAIYPYSDYDGVKMEADDKDYRLMMHKDGWKEVDEIASGGERACLCLSLRIAFATVLTPDLSWLILDEPTHNLDADAVSLLSEAIAIKIPSIVEQTFVITHDIALGEASHGRVFRLERDKSAGEPTRVEAPQ